MLTDSAAIDEFCKNLFGGDRLWILEQIERAKKWDDHLAVNAKKGSFPNPLIEEWKEKAKKWDDPNMTHYWKEDVKIWQEKAQKWDELNEGEINFDELSGMGKFGFVLEWKQKAKKWDNYTSGRVVSLVTGEEKEKAKKWDMLKQEFESISEA